jgi:hypothetical protein
VNPPDAVSTALEIAAAVEVGKQVAKQAQEFLAAVSGHPGESFGTMLGTLVRRRMENVEKTTAKSHFILLNLGLTPNEIPLHVLQPALEGASLQEEPSMQDIWANLIANAADPRKRQTILPTFVAILKELTPAHAVLLDALYKDALKKASHLTPPDQVTYEITDIKRLFDQSICPPTTEGQHSSYTSVGGEFLLLVTVLTSHDLLFTVLEEAITTVDSRGRTRALGKRFFTLTELGVAFVKACQPPQPDTRAPA